VSVNICDELHTLHFAYHPNANLLVCRCQTQSLLGNYWS